jgi:hypothetical protein
MEELLAISRADLAASQDTCAKLRIELASARLTLEDVRANQACCARLSTMWNLRACDRLGI